MKTAFTQTVRQSGQSGSRINRIMPWRALLLTALIALMAMDSEAFRIIVQSVSDAYLQVSVFVAATLAIFYGLEKVLKLDVEQLLQQHQRWEVPLAALMGALPGCGGAVMVITQYVHGRLGFGAMVAVLTATMGDAAFLLLAREPMTGLGVMLLSILVGVISGYTIDAIHGPGFMRMDGSKAACRNYSEASSGRWLKPVWTMLLLPGVVLGMMLALQLETDSLFGPIATLEPTLWLGFIGGIIAMLMWSNLFTGAAYRPLVSENRVATMDDNDPHPTAAVSTLGRVIEDTNFVTVWVVMAYLIYELGVHYSGVDLAQWFTVWAPLAPLIGVLVGLLPGCGPQIVTTSLYLAGIVPLSAQLSNAISNDGDALFPAIAMAPKAAILATAYSAVPALIVAYATYFLLEA